MNLDIEKKKTKKVTVPEPFNLTKIKPRKILEPIKIPTKVEIKEVPYEKFQKTSLSKIEEESKARKELLKEKVVKKYEEFGSFELETEKRPTNIEKVTAEVEMELQKKLQFNKKYCGPIKDFSKCQAEIKYNETAILRENLMLERKRKEEEEMLNKIIVEKKDTKEFEIWKKEMEEKDNIKRMEEIAKRKIMSELSKDNYQEMKTKKIIENKINMAKHKEEELEKMEQKQKENQDELQKKAKLAKEIVKERANIYEGKEKMVQKKTNEYYSQMAELAQKVEKVVIEKKIEEEKKMELINQIRELEKIPVKRTKGFDPTETAGIGLLEELSLVELRERLEEQKRLHKDYIEAKKEEVKLKNEERVESLLEKAKNISVARDKLKNIKEVERKNKKVEVLY